MFDSPPISQLTLMKLQSQKISQCVVFCSIENDLVKIELQFDDLTTVQKIIHEAFNFLKSKKSSFESLGSENSWSLFACRRNGRKCSDLPSFESTQRISLTGTKNFYLENPLKSENTSPKKKSTAISLSTRSIQSQML